MRSIRTAILFCTTLLFATICRADEPATEFFAIETRKLLPLAPADGDLDTLSSTQLSEISLARGWYNGGLSMHFIAPNFRLDARFGGMAFPKASSITYNINASSDPKTWSLLAEQGTATKQGKQFVTEDWRKQRITVILRLLNLKK